MDRADAISNRLIDWLRKLSTCSQPWQIAAAVVLGCACGFLPKANLLFPLSLALIYLLPIHLPVAAFMICVCSLVAPFIHPMHGTLGAWLFQFEFIVQTVTRLDRIALLPWLRLHNTVVAGSVLASTALATPFYLLLHRVLLIHHTSWMANRIRHEQKLATAWKPEAVNSMNVPVESLKESRLASLRPRVVEPHVEPKPLAVAYNQGLVRSSTRTESQAQLAKPATASIDSVHALETLLEQTAADQAEKIDTESILARASRAAELVDDIVQALESELIQRVDTDHQTETYHSHDTTISISRSSGASKIKEPLEAVQSTNTFLPVKESMILASHSPLVSPPTPKHRLGTIGESDTVTQAHETATRNVEIRHEEALRHLLKHLRSLHDEVK